MMLQTLINEWTNHYTTCLQENRPAYGLQDITTTMIGEADITEDINKAFKKARNNKAPGPGNKNRIVDI